MNRIYRCSERLLQQVFTEAGISICDLASEYRLTESVESKNRSFKNYTLTEDDLRRVSLSLWENNPSIAIGFIYTLGFNAGIRCENREASEKEKKTTKKGRIPELLTAFVDFLRFTV